MASCFLQHDNCIRVSTFKKERGESRSLRDETWRSRKGGGGEREREREKGKGGMRNYPEKWEGGTEVEFCS